MAYKWRLIAPLLVSTLLKWTDLKWPTGKNCWKRLKSINNLSVIYHSQPISQTTKSTKLPIWTMTDDMFSPWNSTVTTSTLFLKAASLIWSENNKRYMRQISKLILNIVILMRD